MAGGSVGGPRPILFHATPNPVDIHAAGSVLNVTPNRVDAGWLSVANGANFQGSPDHVSIAICVQVDENAASNYWALPEIIVLRSNDIVTNERIGAASCILMQNNGVYSAQSTLGAPIIDPNPSLNPMYRFVLEDDDNRTIAAVPQGHSHICLTAQI